MEVRAKLEAFKQVVIWLFDLIKGHQINSSQTIPAKFKVSYSWCKRRKKGKVCFGEHIISVETYHRTMFILKKVSLCKIFLFSHVWSVTDDINLCTFLPLSCLKWAKFNIAMVSIKSLVYCSVIKMLWDVL